jgi:hypothetical protein
MYLQNKTPQHYIKYKKFIADFGKLARFVEMIG